MYKLYSATLELTRQCNARCKHCIIDAHSKKENELSTDRIIELIEELHDEGCKDIVFTGGEALLRKEWPLFMQKAHSMDMRCVLMTNGLLLNDDVIKILRLFDVSVGLSLDGATAQTHDGLRGIPGLFDHIVETIRRSSLNCYAIEFPRTRCTKRLINFIRRKCLAITSCKAKL